MTEIVQKTFPTSRLKDVKHIYASLRVVVDATCRPLA